MREADDRRVAGGIRANNGIWVLARKFESDSCTKSGGGIVVEYKNACLALVCLSRDRNCCCKPPFGKIKGVHHASRAASVAAGVLNRPHIWRAVSVASWDMPQLPSRLYSTSIRVLVPHCQMRRDSTESQYLQDARRACSSEHQGGRDFRLGAYERVAAA